MGQHTHVGFGSGGPPPRTSLQLALEDYVRGIASEVRWDDGGARFVVRLPGTCCEPITRLLPESSGVKAQTADPIERWFEVFPGDDYLDVITRHQDELTNNIASGFAQFCARFWSGKLDPEDEDVRDEDEVMNVTKVTALAGHRLELVFSDGTAGEANLSEIVHTFPPFVPLQDETLFRQARVEHGTATWPGGLDVAVERLYALAHGLPPPEDFETAKTNELRMK